MVASSLAHGAGAPKGYDRDSLLHALTETKMAGSSILKGEPLIPGSVEGLLLGGCLTLVETTLGTPWELDTRGAILVLEDRGDEAVSGGPRSDAPEAGGEIRRSRGNYSRRFPGMRSPRRNGVRERCRASRSGAFGVPVVWGAPVGHTERPMLTLPLGVRAHLTVSGTAVHDTQLEILEPACAA